MKPLVDKSYLARQLAVYLIVAALMVTLAGGLPFLLDPLGTAIILLWLSWGVTLGLGRSRGDVSIHEKKQRRIIALSGVICFTLMTLAPWEHVTFSGPLPRTGVIPWLGIAVNVSGILLQAWSLWELGSLYTSHLGIQKRHHLITSGPYRFVRHPGYLSSLVIMLGMLLSMGSLLMLLTVIISTILISWRITEEEHMLVDAFGDDYIKYRKRTHKLIPYLY